jgi:hypothetical protein
MSTHCEGDVIAGGAQVGISATRRSCSHPEGSAQPQIDAVENNHHWSLQLYSQLLRLSLPRWCLLTSTSSAEA